jgi:plasmid stability protein
MQLSIKLPLSIHAAAKARAAVEDRSMAAVIREALRLYLELR